MKFLDRLAILLLNLCILLTSITIPVFSLTANPKFYQTQFEKTGIYAAVLPSGEKDPTTVYYVGGKSSNRAEFTDEQIDEMIDHIICYIFTEQESFELVMDGVMLNGKLTDNVSVFGEVAVGHMVDVKGLFTFFMILTIVLVLLLFLSAGYLIWRRTKYQGLLLKYSLIFYGAFLALIGVFCLGVVLDLKEAGRAVTANNFLDQLWGNFHHILFPFSAEKFENSFFNDTLTQILTLDFFMAAVSTVLIAAGIVLVLWFGFIAFVKIKTKHGLKISRPKLRMK